TMAAATRHKLAKLACKMRAGIWLESARPKSMPKMTEPTKNQVPAGKCGVCHKATPTVLAEISAMTINEVATMLCSCNWVKRCKAGTLVQPPPAPSRPVKKPEQAPMQAMVSRQLLFQMNFPV